MWKKQRLDKKNIYFTSSKYKINSKYFDDFYSIVLQDLKKQIFTSIQSVQHPHVSQNIPHFYAPEFRKIKKLSYLG